MDNAPGWALLLATAALAFVTGYQACRYRSRGDGPDDLLLKVHDDLVEVKCRTRETENILKGLSHQEAVRARRRRWSHPGRDTATWLLDGDGDRAKIVFDQSKTESMRYMARARGRQRTFSNLDAAMDWAEKKAER